MCLLAAATKKVSSEVWALVHEECLDISISGIKPVCVAKYYVVLIPVLFVFLTFCACVGDLWGGEWNHHVGHNRVLDRRSMGI